MKVQFEKEELLEILYSALANGGLIELSMSGVEINYDPELYAEAKYRIQHTQKEPRSICYEDVLVEILRKGEPLHFYEHEGDEDLSFTFEQAEENLSKEEFIQYLLDVKNEQDDAYTGWYILQGALYGEVIFG